MAKMINELSPIQSLYDDDQFMVWDTQNSITKRVDFQTLQQAILGDIDSEFLDNLESLSQLADQIEQILSTIPENSQSNPEDSTSNEQSGSENGEGE